MADEARFSEEFTGPISKAETPTVAFSLKFGDYQTMALSSRIYSRKIGLWYTTLKLNGEAGEVAEKVGKLYRDKDGVIDDAFRESVCLELGDVLWYICACADEIGLTLEQVAVANLNKLDSRAQRGVLKGDGDNR